MTFTDTKSLSLWVKGAVEEKQNWSSSWSYLYFTFKYFCASSALLLSETAFEPQHLFLLEKKIQKLPKPQLTTVFIWHFSTSVSQNTTGHYTIPFTCYRNILMQVLLSCRHTELWNCVSKLDIQIQCKSAIFSSRKKPFEPRDIFTLANLLFI